MVLQVEQTATPELILRSYKRFMGEIFHYSLNSHDACVVRSHSSGLSQCIHVCIFFYP